MHADFLLAASRESIEYYRPWNLALRKGLRDAFMKAIERFRVEPEEKLVSSMHYVWPLYLKRGGGHRNLPNDFWGELHQDILSDLGYRQVLKSRDLSFGFRKPRELRYLPKAFRFSGEALFESRQLMLSQLSFKYDDVHQQLRLIGVEEMTKTDLSWDFVTWIQETGITKIKEMSEAWHIQVAAVFGHNWETRDRLRTLPIIPLKDGTWVRPDTEHLYCPSPNGFEVVPDGLGVLLVDSRAVGDPRRRRFYEYLGVQAYSSKVVCDLILQLHKSAAIYYRSFEDLIHDGVYLYRNQWLPNGEKPPSSFQYVAGQQGKLDRRSDRIYICDPTANPAIIAKHKDAAGSPFVVLDHRYLDALTFGTESDATMHNFYTFLLSTGSFSSLPVLSHAGAVTPEFYYLRDTDIYDLFLALKETVDPSIQVQDAAKILEVRCLDGIARPLRDVALPTDALLKACPHLPFIEMPQSEDWTFLQRFGVIVRPGTTAFLRELSAISQLPADSVQKDAAHELYRALSMSPECDKDEIR